MPRQNSSPCPLTADEGDLPKSEELTVESASQFFTVVFGGPQGAFPPLITRKLYPPDNSRDQIKTDQQIASRFCINYCFQDVGCHEPLWPGCNLQIANDVHGLLDDFAECDSRILAKDN